MRDAKIMQLYSEHVAGPSARIAREVLMPRKVEAPATATA